MADSLSITKERVPLSALEKFPNSGRVRISYCEAASTSTAANQPPPTAMMKMATKQPQLQQKQPKAIGRSNSFTFDFVRPQVFKSVCHEFITRDNEKMDRCVGSECHRIIRHDTVGERQNFLLTIFHLILSYTCYQLTKLGIVFSSVASCYLICTALT